MANWWQSILEQASQIKGKLANGGNEVLYVIIVLCVGVSGFILGRLSNSEEYRPAIRMFESKTYDRAPMVIGGKVVASKNGTKYHFPWCSGARTMSDANKVWFDSEENARAAGYTPAGNCKGLK